MVFRVAELGVTRLAYDLRQALLGGHGVISVTSNIIPAAIAELCHAAAAGQWDQARTWHYSQLPLARGDAAFFNPALFHGAGTNRTSDVRRMANLLQVSSAFGRAMETVDTRAITTAVYPVLRRWVSEGAPARAVANVVTVAAEGYPFPTNLDHDQPVGSMVPESQAALVRRALAEGWDVPSLEAALVAQTDRRRSRAGS